MINIPHDLYITIERERLTEPKKCFKNAFQAVMLGHFEILVLGFAELPGEKIVVRHAWVESKNSSYDPTLQKSGNHLRATYKPVYRLNKNQILNHMKSEFGEENFKKIMNNKMEFNPPSIDSNNSIVYVEV